MSQALDSLSFVDLTADQRWAVEHAGSRTVIAGEVGTGKTTALLARYRLLTRQFPPSRVLVLCRDRAAAQRFTDAVLGDLQGGLDTLPITTVYGLAYALLAGAGTEIRLLSEAEQRVRLKELLAAERSSDWPILGRLVGRKAFLREVVAALSEVQAAGYPSAEAAGGGWLELARFSRRYVESLEETGEADASLLLAKAARQAAAERDRFDHVLIDDAGALPVLGSRLVAALVGDSMGWTVACEGPDEVPLLAPAVTELSRRFRAAPLGHLVLCSHPSIEPEAIAGELLAAHAEGVAWSEMAVLVRQLGHSARAIARALARHGIPMVPLAAQAADEPVVRAVLDLLRWVGGDEEVLDRLLVSPLADLEGATVRAIRRDSASTGRRLEDDPRLAPLRGLRDHLRARMSAGDTPADLVYEAWARGLSDLAGNDRRSQLGAVDDRALDALVALTDGLRQFAERNVGASLGETLAAVEEGSLDPDPWRVAASAGADGVTITSVEASAGREWHTVVIAGCVEGELPRPRRGLSLFDPALLAGGPASMSSEDRPRQALADERRLFAIATSRARSTLVATAAPQPGVLLSRFVENWPPAPLRLPLAPGQPPPVRAVTASPVPVAPDRRLHLSATQLDTYDDCPLRYAYQYVLRARDEPGVHASLGSLVHKVLATFLDPKGYLPRTFDSLMSVAGDVWREDVARYRPQIEEARRDFVSMLTAWWEQEGSREDFGPEVLAVERRFRFDLGPHSVAGAIDRIDRADDGVGIRVVDYKTGKREPAPADVAEDLQLAVYHLAASRDPELAALGAPTQLHLRYLRTMRTYDQRVTDGHAATTEERVLATAERILAEDFTPSVHANCRTCSFHRLCPLWPEGRQVGTG